MQSNRITLFQYVNVYQVDRKYDIRIVLDRSRDSIIELISKAKLETICIWNAKAYKAAWDMFLIMQQVISALKTLHTVKLR